MIRRLVRSEQEALLLILLTAIAALLAIYLIFTAITVLG